MATVEIFCCVLTDPGMEDILLWLRETTMTFLASSRSSGILDKLLWLKSWEESKVSDRYGV